ncbi:MAG: GNAT family N-acetyltransferase [Sandaracinaceae bacterium]|nr:GNAT family N-acetyltransferase [Myxococcales bacterium]
MTVRLVSGAPASASALSALYASVGWSAHAEDPARLRRAIDASTYVCTAWEGDDLVGLLRASSDEVYLCFIHDLLVAPTQQRRGVGRRLVERCLEAHPDVARFTLLTDAAPAPIGFYRALGFDLIGDDEPRLAALIRARG